MNLVQRYNQGSCLEGIPVTVLNDLLRDKRTAGYIITDSVRNTILINAGAIVLRCVNNYYQIPLIEKLPPTAQYACRAVQQALDSNTTVFDCVNCHLFCATLKQTGQLRRKLISPSRKRITK